MSEQRSSADSAAALRLLAAEDERQSKLHELLETIREQIRLEVAPEHRPEGLFKNIQDAVYAMRGRTPLMDDAAITHVLNAPQSASMPQNVEVAIKRMKTLADTALPGRTYEEECQAQMRNACVLLEMAYRSQAENVALQDARDEFEAIRLLLINDLAEPGRSAFWKAVNARDKIAALTRPPHNRVEKTNGSQS